VGAVAFTGEVGEEIPASFGVSGDGITAFSCGSIVKGWGWEPGEWHTVVDKEDWKNKTLWSVI
jgi:hypothetical protein